MPGQPRQRADRQHRRDGDQRVGADLDGPAVGRDQPAGEKPMMKPEMIAAISIPVPV